VAFAEKQKLSFEKLLDDTHVEASLVDTIVRALSLSLWVQINPAHPSFPQQPTEAGPLKERAALIKGDYVLNSQSEVKIKELQADIQQQQTRALEREEHTQALSVKIQLLEDRMEKSKKQVEAAVVSALLILLPPPCR